MARDRSPQADAGCKIVVALGAMTSRVEAAFGELGAGIVDRALDHLVIAPQHQYVASPRRAQPPGASRSPSNELGSCCVRFRSALRRSEPLGSGQHRGPATSITSSNASVPDGERGRAASIGRQARWRAAPWPTSRCAGSGIGTHRRQRDLLVSKIPPHAVDEKIGHAAAGFRPAARQFHARVRLQLARAGFRKVQRISNS